MQLLFIAIHQIELVIPKLHSAINSFISAVFPYFANILLKRANKGVGSARKNVEKKIYET